MATNFKNMELIQWGETPKTINTNSMGQLKNDAALGYQYPINRFSSLFVPIECFDT